MNSIRLVSVVLFALPLTALAACGGDDATTSAPPAATAPAPAATSAAATDTAGAGDKELCEAADLAKTSLTTALMTAMGSGDQLSPDVKKAIAEVGSTLTSAAESGGDSEVATSMKELGDEVSKAAEASDVTKAMDSASLAKAGERFDAACKKAGFTPKS